MIWISGCGRMRSDIVAQVGDWKMTVTEFKDEAMKKLRTPQKAAEASTEDLAKILDDVVIRQLKIVDAYNKGFDTAPDIQKAYQEELDKGAVMQLYINEIRDKLITDAMVREYYDHDEELNAAHILIKTGEGINEEEAKKKIDKVYREVTAPDADFKAISDKYNEDESVKKDGGDLGWFGWGRMVDPFQEVVFSMKPGEISQPVKTEFGWHVIKLLGRRKIENRPSFEEDKENLRNQLARQHGEEVEKAAEEFINKEKEFYGVEYFEDNIASLTPILESNKGNQDLFALLNEEQQKLPLAHIRDGNITVTASDFSDKLKRVGRSGMEIKWGDIGKKLIDEVVVMGNILPKAAKRLGYYNNKEVVDKAVAARDRKVLYAAQTEIINKKAEPTEEQIKQYYDSHPDEFMTEPQYTIHEVLVSDKKLAEQLVERARKGEDMQKLAVKYSERENAKRTKGVLGPFKKTQHGVIGKEAARAEIGDVVGPITHGDKWSVFKLVAREEPQLENYNKVKRKAETSMRRELSKKLEDEWVVNLKESIHYKVNTKALENLFEEKQDTTTTVARGK